MAIWRGVGCFVIELVMMFPIKSDGKSWSPRESLEAEKL